MRGITVTVTNTGTSNVVPLDQYISPFNIGLGCVVVSGSPTFTVQHTFDNVLDPEFSASTATWFNHSDIASQTSNIDGNYAFPVSGIRLNVTGTGVVQMKAIQAGIAS